MSRAGGFPAVGLLVDLLPVGLLVGEVAAGLAAILLHASKLIYPSIRRPFGEVLLSGLAHFPKQIPPPPQRRSKFEA